MEDFDFDEFDDYHYVDDPWDVINLIIDFSGLGLMFLILFDYGVKSIL